MHLLVIEGIVCNMARYAILRVNEVWIALMLWTAFRQYGMLCNMLDILPCIHSITITSGKLCNSTLFATLALHGFSV